MLPRFYTFIFFSGKPKPFFWLVFAGTFADFLGLAPQALSNFSLKEILFCLFLAGSLAAPSVRGCARLLCSLCHRRMRWATMPARTKDVPLGTNGVIKKSMVYEGLSFVKAGRIFSAAFNNFSILWSRKSSPELLCIGDSRRLVSKRAKTVRGHTP